MTKLGEIVKQIVLNLLKHLKQLLKSTRVTVILIFKKLKKFEYMYLD